MKTTGKATIRDVIALMVVGGFLAYIFTTSFHEIPAGSKDLSLSLSEVLKSAVMILVGWLFRSAQEQGKPPQPEQSTTDKKEGST